MNTCCDFDCNSEPINRFSRRQTIISKLFQFCRQIIGPSANNENVAISSEPLVIPRGEHGISRKQFSPNAIKVLYRLKDGGYDAYLVGGCIRDDEIGCPLINVVSIFVLSLGDI